MEKVVCDICGKELANKYTLKKHKQNIHNIGVDWQYCDIEGCPFKTKNSCMKRHKWDVHDIGVDWIYCLEKNCDFKTKFSHKLTDHLWFKHNINEYDEEFLKNNDINSEAFKHYLRLYFEGDHKKKVVVEKVEEEVESVKDEPQPNSFENIINKFKKLFT